MRVPVEFGGDFAVARIGHVLRRNKSERTGGFKCEVERDFTACSPRQSRLDIWKSPEIVPKAGMMICR
jgi:hypothetical protein